MAETLSITVGLSRGNPQGTNVPLSPSEPPGLALAHALEAQPTNGERWWSVHNWSDARRKAAAWVSSAGVGVDLDYEDQRDPDPKKWAHVAPPAEVAAACEGAAELGLLPGSVFHLTPRGARLIFAFRTMVTSRDLMTRAARGAGAQVAEAIGAAGLPVAAPGSVGYCVDQGVLTDLARLLFAPRCQVEGIRRDARILVMRPDGFDAKELVAPARVLTLVQAPGAPDIGEAVEKYNREHARSFPKNGSQCPVCGHHGCFGTLKDSDGSKWSCFSANHAGAGHKKDGGPWAGDVLDLDAHAAGRSPVDHLKATGYLKAPERVRAQSCEGGENVIAMRDPGARDLKSNSFASIVFVLKEAGLREKVLGRGVIEFNEMALTVTMNRRPIEDVDYLRVRELCETELGEDSSHGFKFSRMDIQDAMLHVAKMRRYHPVLDYLRSLVWDRVPRIGSIPEDVLGLSPSPLASSLIRRWMTQACARVERPGCKAHGVLIFVGPGGIGKSTFFEVLASPAWFGDTAMNLEDKSDAYLKLHTTWIYEWGELESMQRARSQNAVKAFVTSPSDRFRAPYARDMEIHERRFVLCGTANPGSILTEAPGAGNRRWWTIETPGRFDLALLKENRDQYWAEAYAAFRAGETWHLSDAEEVELEAAQDKHMKHDPWEDRIRAWISQHKITETKPSAVLAGAIDKKIDQWTERDEQRIVRILQGMRWPRQDKTIDGVLDSVYVNPDVLPF